MTKNCKSCGTDVTTVPCCHFELVNVTNNTSYDDHPDNIIPGYWCSMTCFINWVDSL